MLKGLTCLCLALSSLPGCTRVALPWYIPAGPGVYQAAPSYPHTAAQMIGSVGLRHHFVSPSALRRRVHPPMRPRYITIHATGDSHMGASDYATAMTYGLKSVKRAGATGSGRLSWHFTVDMHYAVQHLTTHVQGGHADFNGPGNKSSIGIEMCEYRGCDIGAVMDRTARLTAYLMWQHGIPINQVVPHYHWPRAGTRPIHKACPHFLMDHGKPGPKWQAFLARVNAYYLTICRSRY